MRFYPIRHYIFHFLLRPLCVMLLLSAYLVGVSAQDIVVVGQVVSAVDGTPLPAATVRFKGTDIGTITNNEGFFMIRSLTPQKSLTVSTVGYRTRNVQLDYGRDQMIEIVMQEDISLLDEVVVIPDGDKALELMRKVRDDRHLNDPRSMANVKGDRQDISSLKMVNIKSKTLRRRVFKELAAASVEESDSTYSIPLYIGKTQSKLNAEPDTVASPAAKVDTDDNPLELQLAAFANLYTPDVDIYKPYITVMGQNYITPLSKSAKQYYYMYLADSTVTDSCKLYLVKFRPKKHYTSALRGEMWVDSATHAVVSSDVAIPDNALANFLNDYSYRYRAASLGNSYFTSVERQDLSLSLNPIVNNITNGLGTLLQHERRYSNVSLAGDTIRYLTPQIPVDTISDSHIGLMTAKIDSLNMTRIRKLAEFGVDLVLNQYFHVWQIDIGPVLNMFRYNRYEGATPRLSLRSGERFSKNFTFGGYYGYGFKDEKHKYGAGLEWKFGREKRHYLALHYDNKAERVGYDDLHITNENRVHELDHLFNSMFIGHYYPTLMQHARIKAEYAYIKPGLKFRLEAKAEKVYANQYLYFIQNGYISPVWDSFDNMDFVSRDLRYMNLMTLKGELRLSWQEKYLDQYFHRISVSSQYPIVTLSAEGGYVGLGSQISLFGRFGVYARQDVNVGFGKLQWAFQANAIVGNVPYPLLIMSKSSRVSYYTLCDFSLLSQMEFMSDMYTSLNIRFQTRGYIFGYIPKIQRLGIRENIIFNIGYGSRRKSHTIMSELPAFVHDFNRMPYIEAGFGLSNILHIADLEFIWRVTHRDNPMGSNFGIRYRISF